MADWAALVAALASGAACAGCSCPSTSFISLASASRLYHFCVLLW